MLDTLKPFLSIWYVYVILIIAAVCMLALKMLVKTDRPSSFSPDYQLLPSFLTKSEYSVLPHDIGKALLRL